MMQRLPIASASSGNAASRALATKSITAAVAVGCVELIDSIRAVDYVARCRGRRRPQAGSPRSIGVGARARGAGEELAPVRERHAAGVADVRRVPRAPAADRDHV